VGKYFNKFVIPGFAGYDEHQLFHNSDDQHKEVLNECSDIISAVEIKF
jgi:hypothetical protein